MRIFFALSGLHRIDRGAEMAFISIAENLALRGHEVTLAGSGPVKPGKPYRFLHVPSLQRKFFERFPKGPYFRDETAFEELSFIPGLFRVFDPRKYDLTVTCSYPYTNWALRRPVVGGVRPAHVFVTENGDWPARTDTSEYRFFSCDGLVCINPDFLEANAHRWNCALIPNGVDVSRFSQAQAARDRFGLPAGKKVILMVSALIASKRVREAVEAVSRLQDVHLVVAGDGPEKQLIAKMANEKMPGRFSNILVAPRDMPSLYQSADVFLHMSLAESFGNVFLEAMSAGLPIVGHDSPRLRWILGNNGTLLDTTNLGIVADRLKNLERPSASQKAQLEQAASRFGWPEIARQYEEFFTQVIEIRNRKSNSNQPVTQINPDKP